MKNTRFLLSVLVACLFIASRYLVGRISASPLALPVLSLLWCVPCALWLLKRRQDVPKTRKTHAGMSLGLLLLFLGILLLWKPSGMDSAGDRSFLALADLVVLGPVLEEWVFRGMFREAARPEKPAFQAFSVLLSSLLFAFSHPDLSQASAAFVFSLMAFCLLYVSSSLVWPVAFHMLCNLASFFLVPLWLGAGLILLGGTLAAVSFLRNRRPPDSQGKPDFFRSNSD